MLTSGFIFCEVEGLKTYREIFTFKTLYQAHILTRRSKRHKKEIVLFEMETGKKH